MHGSGSAYSLEDPAVPLVNSSANPAWVAGPSLQLLENPAGSKMPDYYSYAYAPAADQGSYWGQVGLDQTRPDLVWSSAPAGPSTADGGGSQVWWDTFDVSGSQMWQFDPAVTGGSQIGQSSPWSNPESFPAGPVAVQSQTEQAPPYGPMVTLNNPGAQQSFTRS